jgi:predicted nucleic acid-binding protein
MDIVIDASAIIAVVTKEPLRADLIEATRGADLLAPYSVHWEIGNAFSAMFKRNRATVEQALDAIRAYENIPIRLLDVDLSASLEIAGRLGLYAYDAYLIRCALQYNAPLLTLDRGLISAAQESNARVIEVM